MQTSNLVALLAFPLALVSAAPAQTKHAVPHSHQLPPALILAEDFATALKSLRKHGLLDDLVSAVAPEADLEELIQTIRDAGMSLEITVDIAIMEVTIILADAPAVLQHLLDVVQQVEAVVQYIVQSAIQEVINNPSVDLPDLSRNVTAALRIIIQSAAQEARNAVNGSVPQVLHEIEFNLGKIDAEFQRATASVLDVVKELSRGTETFIP